MLAHTYIHNMYVLPIHGLELTNNIYGSSQS